MKTISRILLMAALAASCFSILSAEPAEGGATLRLWPTGVPGKEPQLGPEHDTTKDTDGKVGGRRVIRVGNVSNPEITLYRPPTEKANGAAVLVCPGGAYNILAMDLEGTEVCERLNAMGVTAVLLKYRVPRRAGQEKHVAPLQDAQRAMGLIRQHAEEWKVDPKRIGVLGFSAGGHLAAALSNNYQTRTYPKVDAADDLSCRPDFTILIYPAYLTPDKDRTTLAPEIKVSSQTPQAFITMAEDDPVHVENAFAYASALKKENIPFELHIYPTGGHGYGLRKTAQPVTGWPELLEKWFHSRRIEAKAER